MRTSGLGVVVGASPLGIGIAALLANAGWQVHLLDSSLEVAGKAVAQLRLARPPQLYVPEYLERLHPGNLNDLTGCREADWVVEAIADNLELKRRLLQRLELFLGPQTLLTTTTHTLTVAALAEGMDEAVQGRFFATHFFVPPRYQRLIEVARGAATEPEAVERFCRFAEEQLGKRTLLVEDSPGFVARRVFLGHFLDVLRLTQEHGATIEQADAATGAALGRSQGLFQQADQLGLEALLGQARGLQGALPDDPALSRLCLPPSVEKRLAAQSWHGFWPREGNLVLDLATGEYRAPGTRQPEPSFLTAIQESLFDYVDTIRPQIAGSEVVVDQAMTWGYGWRTGPFALEAERRGRLYAAPSPAPEYLDLAHWPVVESKPEGDLHDLGDGVACFALHPSQGRLDANALAVLVAALERAEREYLALVVTASGTQFVAGFDLARWWAAIQQGELAKIQAEIEQAQAALQRLSAARIPVVGAVQGFVRGGGAELALHLPTLHLAPETYIGLPQVTAGLLPSFGGLTELYRRLKSVRLTVQAVMGAQVTTSAQEARKLGWLRQDDTIGVNPDRLLAEARARVLELTEQPRRVPEPLVPSAESAVALQASMGELHQQGRITAYELQLAQQVIQVLCDGPCEEAAIRRREQEACLVLCQEARTQERMRHLLETGQPLRN